MATIATRPISNIAVAFAAQSATAAADGDDNKCNSSGDAGHPPQQPPASKGPLPVDLKQLPLLTPPNSISPTLPPHRSRPAPSSPLAQPAIGNGDSDIDLQDAVEHAAAQDQPTALSSAALSGLDAAGAITPSMLAKHHLPDILLAHGPMAIRHVLSYLTQSVPGFARIPPTKARRLVVAALEMRGGGGVKGDVEFEKVGWGRWDARIRGQLPREPAPAQPGSAPVMMAGARHLSPPASVPESYTMSSMGGLKIPGAKYPRGARRGDIYTGSWAGESHISSRVVDDMDDKNMAEHEADKMSLDGSSRPSSGGVEELPNLEDDTGDVTDEEDWAGIGADALMQGSHGTSGIMRPAPRSRSHHRHHHHRHHNYASRHPMPHGGRHSHHHHGHGHGGAGAGSLPLRVSSAPGPSRAAAPGGRGVAHPESSSRPATGASTARGGAKAASATLDKFGVMELDVKDDQERTAIEALLRMGSM